MSIPDAAIEAAAEAHYVAEFGRPWAYVLDAARETYRIRARAAIEAAMPAIREALAQEIEADIRVHSHTGFMYAGMARAAAIVRGGTP